MTTNHTPGPWEVVREGIDGEDFIIESRETNQIIVCDGISRDVEMGSSDWNRNIADARLIAAAPELLEALEGTIDLAWIEDSHQVQLDATVLFGELYDFSGLDGARRIEFFGQHSCIVWPGSKWSAYCTYDGSMWFEKFDAAEEAKEACMRLLDKVLPDHPAMRARAVIRKARGTQ